MKFLLFTNIPAPYRVYFFNEFNKTFKVKSKIDDEKKKEALKSLNKKLRIY